jgi:hypothetical protein
MTLWQAVALFLAGYILLLARSAWLQGELRQFLLSLGVVAGLAAVVGLVVLAWSRLAG